MSSLGAEITVEGFVQGVGYRYYCYKAAKNLNLTGWARNNPDGSVSVMAEGDRSQIEYLINMLKIGPPAANVKDVKTNWMKFTGAYNSFDVVGR